MVVNRGLTHTTHIHTPHTHPLFCPRCTQGLWNERTPGACVRVNASQGARGLASLKKKAWNSLGCSGVTGLVRPLVVKLCTPSCLGIKPVSDFLFVCFCQITKAQTLSCSDSEASLFEGWSCLVVCFGGVGALCKVFQGVVAGQYLIQAALGGGGLDRQLVKEMKVSVYVLRGCAPRGPVPCPAAQLSSVLGTRCVV